MVIELNDYIPNYQNVCSANGGVSMTLSPGAIVTGLVIDCKKHCKLQFNEYVHTYEENTPNNSMQARSLGNYSRY